MDNLYDTDFYMWVQNQVSLMKNKDFDNIDFENIIEEIDSLGRKDVRSLESYMVRLLNHLLKWVLQPERRGSSWEISIYDSRDKIEQIIEDSQSLKNKLISSMDIRYLKAVKQVVKISKIDKTLIPEKCPWDFETIMDEDFWPEKFE